MTITFPLPTELQGVGRVVGRFIVVTPDTVNDVDVYPEARGSTGSVTFTPSTKLSKTADYAAFVGHPSKTFPVDAYGVMQDEELTGGVWLREDVYTVSYNLSGLNIASHTIEVTSGHTEEDPLVLSAVGPAEPPTGSTLMMLQVPAGAVNGQLLSWSGTTGLVWVAQSGVSDASTTVKGIAELATNQETIDGTDPARVVTPAGVKAALDAKSVSDMSTYAGMCYVPTIPSALSWPAAYDPGVTAIADVPGGGAAATVTTRPGDIFDAVTTARTNPGAVFYVSTTGSDAAAGTSWATAFRSIRAAILAANTAAVPTLIYVDAGKYERNYQPGHLDASPTVDIAFVANGRVNTGTWDAPATPVADGTYTNTYSWTLSNAERIMTTDVLTADGLYTELLNVATPTLVNTTPGSWCISGGTVYVRRLDGSAPSATNTRIYRGATYQAMRIASHVNVYIGGVNDLSGWDMEGGTSAVLNAYITPAPSSAKVLAVENCTFRYAGGTTANAKGVRVDSWRGLAYFYNCSSDANSSDGFNFHNGSAAADVHALTVNCSGHDNGRKGNASCNGWTNHEDCVGIDVSGVYKRNRGGTVACINSCLTYLAGSVVMDDLGDIALGGTQVPTGIRTADTAEMWVERARVVLAASGQARAYEARGTSQIHRRNTWPVPQADSIDAGATIDTY